MVNTTCTNVPGAREPIYFAGAKCVSSFGAGPVVDGMGLINVITSYVDDLVLAFTACREMMPDPRSTGSASRRAGPRSRTRSGKALYSSSRSSGSFGGRRSGAAA